MAPARLPAEIWRKIAVHLGADLRSLKTLLFASKLLASSFSDALFWKDVLMRMGITVPPDLTELAEVKKLLSRRDYNCKRPIGKVQATFKDIPHGTYYITLGLEDSTSPTASRNVRTKVKGKGVWYIEKVVTATGLTGVFSQKNIIHVTEVEIQTDKGAAAEVIVTIEQQKREKVADFDVAFIQLGGPISKGSECKISPAWLWHGYANAHNHRFESVPKKGYKAGELPYSNNRTMYSGWLGIGSDVESKYGEIGPMGSKPYLEHYGSSDRTAITGRVFLLANVQEYEWVKVTPDTAQQVSRERGVMLAQAREGHTVFACRIRIKDPECVYSRGSYLPGKFLDGMDDPVFNLEDLPYKPADTSRFQLLCYQKAGQLKKVKTARYESSESDSD